MNKKGKPQKPNVIAAISRFFNNDKNKHHAFSPPEIAKKLNIQRNIYYSLERLSDSYKGYGLLVKLADGKYANRLCYDEKDQKILNAVESFRVRRLRDPTRNEIIEILQWDKENQDVKTLVWDTAKKISWMEPTEEEIEEAKNKVYAYLLITAWKKFPSKTPKIVLEKWPKSNEFIKTLREVLPEYKTLLKLAVKYAEDNQNYVPEIVFKNWPYSGFAVTDTYKWPTAAKGMFGKIPGHGRLTPKGFPQFARGWGILEILTFYGKDLPPILKTQWEDNGASISYNPFNKGGRAIEGIVSESDISRL